MNNRFSKPRQVAAVASWLWCALAATTMFAASPTFERDVQPLLRNYCFDCHYDGEDPEGGVNLERFTSAQDVLRDRAIWKSVFEKVESRQMPPPKDAALPTDDERQKILQWIADMAARPDPALGQVNPGSPIIRRLTRLEYNNTVRDLLGIETDIFMFPERLPLADKNYFQPAAGTLPGPLTVKVREYGAKYPVLLPTGGLPGDNRAEHGYRNRGDAMNTSPLLLEKYLALAAEIVHHPDLPRRSPTFAKLLGIDPATLPARGQPGQSQDPAIPVAATGEFAPQAEKLRQADGNPDWPAQFREQIATAFSESRGGVFTVPESLKNQTVAGKGGLIKVAFGGGKLLAINPNADLWLVDFATADETSASWLIANKSKGQKVYELTFEIRHGDDDEGIARLGLCVLGRRKQSGTVSLTVTLTDGTTESRTLPIAEGPAGTTFASFAAIPGESIRRLKVDGSNFSGDYVLVDDIGFVTNGRSQPLSVQNTKLPDNHSPSSTSGTASDSASLATAHARPLAPPRERLAAFLRRAFRRPVGDEEVSRYFELFDVARQSGQSEADAMRAAVQAVLASPSFLFLAENRLSAARPSSPGPDTSVPSSSVRQLTDHELACRLSYFLWSSMPDEPLLELADRGKLQDEATLRVQTRRMLQDPKARELSESFAVQWLRMDQLYTAKPDRKLFASFYSGPQGKSTLHAAQMVEALLLFETVLIENHSILDFIAADYTWLNPQLAKLYELENELVAEITRLQQADLSTAAGSGSGKSAVGNRELRLDDKNANNAWRRVPLADGSRGGYLTMSGPLTVTSLPFRTSPVKRGAWLLETIFNRPPTEPKVAFAIENDTKEAAATQSIREKFELHRNKAACYSCHIRLDPPGFALERFDAIGAWRERDAGQPVDAGGSWNGTDFDGPAEFKALLQRDPHEFTRGFIEHLLSFALGRKLEIYDMPAVAEIERSTAEQGFRLQDIVTAITLSRPFRYTAD